MDAFNIEELRLAAKRRLPRAVFDFIDGGAEDERTLRGRAVKVGTEWNLFAAGEQHRLSLRDELHELEILTA